MSVRQLLMSSNQSDVICVGSTTVSDVSGLDGVVYNKGKVYNIQKPDGTFLGIMNGYVYTSTDCVNYMYQGHIGKTNFGTTVSFAGYVNGVYFVGGTAKIATSSDGVNWTVATLDGWNSLHSVNNVVHTGTYFIIVGNSAAVSRSVDCVTWTYTNSLSVISGNFRAFLYNPEISKYAAYTSSNRTAVSDNGYDWKAVSAPAAYTYFNVVNNNLFITDGNGTIYTQASNNFTDLTDWSTNLIHKARLISVGTYSTARSNSGYIMATTSGLAVSSDLISWRYLDSVLTAGFVASSGLVTVYAKGADVAISTDGGFSWSTPSTLGQSFTAVGAIYTGGLFIVWGGTINAGFFYSTDGVQWIKAGIYSSLGLTTTNTIRTIKSISWNGSTFAVGTEEGFVVTSTDGVNWTERDLKISSAWSSTDSVTGLLWTGTMFVAYLGTKVSTSTDGVNWTYQGSLSTAVAAVSQVGVVDGSVVVSDTSQKKIAVSNDCVNWVLYNMPAAISSVLTTNFVQGMILVVGTDYTMQYSTDKGQTWNVAQYPRIASVNNTKLAYVGNMYVAAGATSCATSTDGLNWVQTNGLAIAMAGNSTTISCLESNGTILVAGGVSGKIYTSTDGVNWLYQSGLSATSWGTAEVRTLSWNGSVFIAGGTNGITATSVDAVVWTYSNNLSTAWGLLTPTRIISNGVVSVACGTSGRIATSTDGLVWTYQSGLSTTGWGTASARDMLWNGSVFVVYDGSTRIATSPDGVVWTYILLPLFNYNLGWYNGEYLSSGNPSAIYTISKSTNLTTWTSAYAIKRHSSHLANMNKFKKLGNRTFVYGQTNVMYTATPTTFNYISNNGFTASSSTHDIAWNGTDKYVAVGSLPTTVVTSTDGVAWVATPINVDIGSTSTTKTVDWNGSMFVINTSSGVVYTSPDGITWTAGNINGEDAYGVEEVAAVGYTSSKYIAANTSGRLLISYNGSAWGYLPAVVGWPSTIQPKIVTKGSTFVMYNTKGLAVSSDGVNWNYQIDNIWSNSSESTGSIYVIGDVFLAISSISSKTAVSTDGVSWTVGSVAVPWGSYASTHYVANNGSLIVLVGSSKTSAYYSTDGLNWSASLLPYEMRLSSSSSSLGMYYTGSAFVAFYNYPLPVTAISYDGITWSAQPGFHTSTGWLDYGNFPIRWNGSVFMAIHRTTKEIATSTDGLLWTIRTPPAQISNFPGVNVVAVGSVFVVEDTYWSSSTSGCIDRVFSKDGLTWTDPVTLCPSLLGNNMYWYNYGVSDSAIIVGTSAGNIATISIDC